MLAHITLNQFFVFHSTFGFVTEILDFWWFFIMTIPVQHPQKTITNSKHSYT
jgi:hypothetical protein